MSTPTGDPTVSIIGSIVMGIVRHAVTAFAAGFVTQGIITANQAQTLVAGAVVAVSIAASVYSKAQAASKLAAAKQGVTT